MKRRFRKKFDCAPLCVEFEHIENEHIKKTIARAVIDESNIPDCLRYSTKLEGMRISASTFCKDGDVYDPSFGERIARKKLVRKFMRLLGEAAREHFKMLHEHLDALEAVYKHCDDVSDSILKYLKGN